MSNNLNNRYSFVSHYDDVDFLRILREAPEGSPFILVETRDRKNQAIDWSLFIHEAVLSDDRVEGLNVGPNKQYDQDFSLEKDWGFETFMDGDKVPNYRGISDTGSIPGYVKKQIEQVKAVLLPKNAKTFVTLL